MVQMIQDMPRKVEEGSVWHVLSTSWVNVWQKWVYMSLVKTGKMDEPDETNQMPPKIDSSDLIAPAN